MSQRGNKVFFDAFQTTPSGSNIQILTNEGAPPTTFSTDDSGSLVISNDVNGITIENGLDNGTMPSVTFGPSDNFDSCIGPTYARSNFAVRVSNNASASLLVNASGNTILSGNLLVEKNEVITGNLQVGKDTEMVGNLFVDHSVTVQGQIRSVGPKNQRILLNGTQTNLNIDISQGSFFYIEGNGDNYITCNNFHVGDHLYLQIAGSGTAHLTTGFAPDPLNITKSANMVTFICDGFHMLLVSSSLW